jgi:hypothetical protein
MSGAERELAFLELGAAVVEWSVDRLMDDPRACPGNSTHDARWLNRFAVELQKYSQKRLQLRLRRKRLRQSKSEFDNQAAQINAPVRRCWQNLVPDLQSQIALIAKKKGLVAELEEIVGQLPEPDCQRQPRHHRCQ